MLIDIYGKQRDENNLENNRNNWPTFKSQVIKAVTID